MTTAPQGLTTTLVAEFFSSVGGVLVDVTGIQLQIVRLSDSVIVLGPTSVGVQHPGTGVYTYPWAVPALEPTVDHLVTWSGAVSGVPVIASEIVTITSASGGGVDGGACGVWPVQWGACDLTGISPAVTGVALQAATDVLYALTGRRYGVCQLSIRPCRRECSGDVWSAGGWWEWGQWPRPLFYQGTWYNISCGQCTSGCSCTYVPEALLPSPVSAVTQVKVDGVTLDETAYRVDDLRILVRTDGGIWPICQDLTKADTEVGTWSVTVQFGEAVPVLGQIAVGELACEFARLLSGSDDCALPKPVQTLVRQGVTMNFLDPNEVFANGRVGLYLSDLFISTVNPHGLMERSRVFDIDDPGYRVTNT
jgi:hypothetical protein